MSEIEDEKDTEAQPTDVPSEETAEEKKHVDEDWKREARAEKERLGEKESRDRTTPGSLPAASFELIVTNYTLQALIAMGDYANPVTDKQEVDLDQAKHAIDLLGVLEEKTRGNLTDAESKHLQSTLYDLRMRYVAHARA